MRIMNLEAKKHFAKSSSHSAYSIACLRFNCLQWDSFQIESQLEAWQSLIWHSDSARVRGLNILTVFSIRTQLGLTPCLCPMSLG